MSDLIDRQAAIDALEKVAELFPWRVPGNRDSYDRYNEAWNDAIGRAEIEIEKLPSAQPEIIACGQGELVQDGLRLVQDCIDRQALCEYALNQKDKCVTLNDIMRFPSAQPEPEEFEWCTDCKEYDQTAHCCHRWTKVIRRTVAELKAERKKGRWIQEGHYIQCTQCGVLICKGDLNGDEYPRNYCPNCGVDMKGNNNETD